MIETGLDVLLDSTWGFGAAGLLTNAASLTRNGITSLRALMDNGVPITALFTAEHGYFLDGDSNASVPNVLNAGTPVYALPMDTFQPAPATLEGLSTVIVDLQEVGCRWYTHLMALKGMLTACAAAKIPIIVLDRPNPQGGIIVEGIPAASGLGTPYAPAPIPARHGMTIGEVARLLNATIGADLEVVPMRGWRREMPWAATGLLWTAPSPSLPSLESVLVYTGTCLLEGLNISEGRGTAMPFTQIGATFVDAEAFSAAMNGLQLAGAAFRPTWFKPTHGKYAGMLCGGVRIYPNDVDVFPGFAVGLHLIAALLALYSDQVQFTEQDGKYVFDDLAGAAFIRRGLERGITASELIESCYEEARAFQATSSAHWLYE